MNKHLFVATGLLLASGGLYAQNAKPVTIASGFNQDVIIEDASNVAETSTQSDVDKYQGLDDQGWDLFASSVRERGALTTDGSFTTKHANYKVNLSNTEVVNNALVLKNPSTQGAVDEGTLVFDTPLKADSIYVVGISANGSASVQVQLNYTDGSTSDPFGFDLNNWDSHNSREEALSGLDRIASKSVDGQQPGTMSNSHNFSLYETGLKADTTKEVASVYFSNASHKGLVSILGVAYTEPQEPTTPPEGGDTVAVVGAQPVTITDGFNQDVIIEDASNVAGTSTQSDIDKYQGLDDQGWDLFTSSVRQQGSLTSDGTFKTKHATYKVNISKDEVVNNALVLKNPSTQGTVDNGTLKFDAPLKADSIYLVGISANGTATVQVKLNYADGTASDSKDFTLNNWDTHNNLEEALSGLDRIASKSVDGQQPGSLSNSHNFSLYETGLKADTTKEVESVSISNPAHQGLVSILGVAYTKAPEPTTPDQGDDSTSTATKVVSTPVAISDGFNEDVIAENNTIDNGKLASVTQNDKDQYQGLDAQGFVLFTKSVREQGALSGDDGVFQTAHAKYQAPVNANNGLVLKGSNITASNGTLTFANPVNADTIYVVGISAQRASTVKVVANYDDDTASKIVDLNLNNWDALDHPFTVALDGLDRIASKGDGWTAVGTLSNSHNFRLYEVGIPVDRNKKVTSVYIDRDESTTGFQGTSENGYVTILGVSALVSTADSTSTDTTSTDTTVVAPHEITPLKISDGFNTDVIAESAEKDDQGHLTSVTYFDNQDADGIDNGGCALFTKSVATLGALCGDDGAFTTAKAKYVAPVDTLNALELKDVLTNDAVLTLAKPVKADSIYVVGISGDAMSNIDVNLVYDDESTSDVVSFYLSNWDTYDARHALTGLDRIYTRDIWGNKTGNITTSHAFQLFETGIPADTTKTIVGVHFVRHSNDGHVAILGVTGINSVEQEDVTPPPTTAIKNIDNVEDASTVVGIYSINGTQLSRLQRGLNIVKYSDGKARKIIIK